MMTTLSLVKLVVGHDNLVKVGHVTLEKKEQILEIISVIFHELRAALSPMHLFVPPSVKSGENSTDQIFHTGFLPPGM
jgi:hypothetical protein